MKAVVPDEYISNKVTFLSREFYIDAGAHIPRKSTEFIARSYIDSIKNIQSDVVVADTGTGTGVLAISIALECANVTQVYATDFYDEALHVAAINVKRFLLDNKIKLLRGDLLEPLKDTKIDVIIANLPFADDAKMQLLRPEVKAYEPLTGIHGGKTGFELYDKLFKQLSEYKYFSDLKGIWIFCNKEHLPLVKKYHATLFKDFSLKLVDDAYKDYYQHCLFVRNNNS
jgi:release factor glutamine methyltransferase